MFKDKFPIFQNKDLVFLDSAASTQKPACVLEVLSEFYKNQYSNVHRGNCKLANEATTQYEKARKIVADFINAPEKQVVFTKGATESINLVANGYRKILEKGDEILVCVAEHHANFVPWQQIAFETGAKFVVFDVLDNGEIDMADFTAKLNKRTKLVAVSQFSNVLGIKNQLTEIIYMAHKVGAQVLVDGSQSVAHQKTDVVALDADYFVFSGHKLYGPTGIGVLYGKKEALESLSPYQYGGDMVHLVSIEETLFKEAPYKFEAGTPPFAQAIALAAAISFLNKISMDVVEEKEKKLTAYLLNQLSKIPEIEILAPNDKKQGIVSFVIQNIHPSDIAFALAEQNICVRVGHHCAMPLHTRFKKDVTLRVSLGIYNDMQDIDLFIEALIKSINLFKGYFK
mgnify:CR=1 FL=1